MLKLLAALALVGATLGHRYKGAEYQQTKLAPDYVDSEPTWDESHGYEECEEFLNDPVYDEVYEEKEEGVVVDGNEADNGMHHFLHRHLPKPIKDICTTDKACPNFERLPSAGCGFETIVIPEGNWMVADFDVNDDLGVRSAYKNHLWYKYRKPNRVPFVVPVFLKWHLNEAGERVRGEIAMYIHADFQDNPPSSNYDELRIERWAETKVYARPYGGHRDDDAFDRQFDLLHEAVENAGLEVIPNVEMEAGYTYLRYGRQRIEAMLIAQEDLA